ncbi:MAG: DUF4783 domain-containing protein [Bacteroidales bacterium]|jgi:hypothetical protein|nr:DUF4783 domain-containing protein [Bacteroidales bacterium]
MMKRIITTLILSFSGFAGLFSQAAQNQASEQDVFVPIAKYIQNGDAERLAVWFASNLEIDILGTNNVCSRQQAKQILKEFFGEYSPKSFVIQYRSGKPPMKYAVGNLSAGGSKFRVTLFVKTQKEGNYIQQLRIEKE